MADPRPIALLLAASLVLPMPKALPAVSPKDALEAEQALLLLREKQPRRQAPARIGSYVLYPDGFGFQIPHGMTLQNPPRGTAAVLVDTIKGSVRANLTLTITDEDSQLSTKSQKDVEGAAKMMGLSRFRLLSFSHEMFYGEKCLRYTFLTGTTPRMLLSYVVFNHGGKCYILTLYAEYTLGGLADALRQYRVFCDSFFFLEDQAG